MTKQNINIDIIIIQILVLFLLAIIGFLSGKFKYMPEKSGLVISKLVIKITMPMTILSNMLRSTFTRDDYVNGVKLYFMALIFILLTLLVSTAYTKFAKLEENTAVIYKVQSMFGNVIFFAFPLFLALFGEKGVLYALFYNMGNDTLLWTLGIYLLSKEKTSVTNRISQGLKHLVNPNTICFIIGIILMLTNFSGRVANSTYGFAVSTYSVLYQTIDMIGKATSPLSMIFVGIILSEVKIDGIKYLKERLPLLVLSLQKLIFLPIIAMGVMVIFRKYLSDIIIIGVLQLAMPTGTVQAALAAEYGRDYKFASEGILVTTLLSLLTLPLMAELLKIIFT
ncbi:MAG: AEC family transporter [Clostridiales bacterium]|jgi:predicted permease|nr:AEC family transporter [Clostridiales bacterium]